ncbi:MAG TPA: flagellar hook-associated protein FlgK [Tissierellaceae bacterium]
MSGLFNTLNTANKGLMTQQTALHVTGHNITNANTPGFTRQRLDVKADLAFRYTGVGQLGTGTKMSGIVRFSNAYVARQIRQENGVFEKFKSKSEAIDELEMIFNEPSSSGLNFYIGEMFDSWKELSMNPELSTSKTLVVEKSIAFTDIANHMLNQMDSLTNETHGQIEKNVLDFNTTIDKLDSLNRQIYNIGIRDEVPNDLLDQRDLFLKDLSSLADFTADFDKYGRVEVKLNSEDGSKNILEFNGNKAKLQYDKNENNPDEVFSLVSNVGDKEEKQIIKISSGSIKGYRDSLSDIKIRSDELKLNIKVIAQSVNKVHGDDIFKIEDSGRINVVDKYKNNHSLINASGAKFGKNNQNTEAGNGDRALAISKIREVRFKLNDNNIITNTYDKDTLSFSQDNMGKTIEGMYRDTVAKIGISKQHSDNMIENQEALLDQLNLRRESESGVSLDEEVSNVIKFQKAYEANARVISVLTEMLDTLINRTGV